MTETLTGVERPGVLEIRLDNKSDFLSRNLPYVVRDAEHTVVREGQVGRTLRMDLAPGLYSVCVMAPDGGQVTRLVQVTGEATTPLLFQGDEFSEGSVEDLRSDEAVFIAGPHPFQVGVAADEPDPVELLGTDRCEAQRDEDGWTFHPLPDPDAVPTAEFSVGSQRWVVSLPVNPRGRRPDETTCRVVPEFDAGRTRLRVRFGTQRRVSRMVNGLCRHHEAGSSAEILNAAANELLGKYQDPAGAALGGLTLHRLGQLPERRDWVENLARDFTWIPDGQILMAALLRRGPGAGYRREGLDLLLRATSARPLYSDGLSLGLELLRRWPGDARADERADRLERLADYSAYADWDTVALTTLKAEGE